MKKRYLLKGNFEKAWSGTGAVLLDQQGFVDERQV